MFTIRGSYHRWTLRARRRPSFCIQFVIVFIICAFLYDRIVIENRYFQQRKVIVQNDLLDYNENGLRSQWNFQMNKHYDVSELRTYKSKPKILAKFDLPGEKGDQKLIPIYVAIKLLQFLSYFQALPLFYRQSYKIWLI